MSERITKNMARNIYFGGGVFAILVFAGLTMDTVGQVPKLSKSENITESVAHGKHLWEKNNCVRLSYDYGRRGVLCTGTCKCF